MKLIDILLSELPERGGWPVGMVTCCQSVIDSEIYFYRNSKKQGEGAPELADFSFYPSKRQRSEARGYFYVTRDEYESALPGNPVPSRSAICDVIYGAICKADRKDNRSDEAEAVYDAIAAGKIPGINLSCRSVHQPIYVGLEEAAKPLIKWIAENCNPHSTVIVDGGSAVLYSAENSVITDEFIKD